MRRTNERTPAACLLALVLLPIVTIGAAACGGGVKDGSGCAGSSCAPAASLDAGAGGAGQAGAAGAAGAAGVIADAARVPVTLPKGACVPDGPTPDALGAARSVLVTGPRKLAAVASTTPGVLVSDVGTGIFRLATGSTALEQVVAGVGPSEFLAADLHIYWPQADGIYKASISATDATPELVGGGLQHPVTSLAFDASNLYFVDGEGQSVLRLGLTGGAVATLVSGVTAQDLVMHAGYLYYPDSNTKQAYRVSTKAGSKPEALTAGTHVAPLAVETDGNTLYWVDDTQILSTPIGKAMADKALGVAGPSPASGLGRIHKLRLAANHLYWADDAGNVGWTSVDGTSCALLVKAAGAIQGWDIDDTSVYVTVTSPNALASELWKIAR